MCIKNGIMNLKMSYWAYNFIVKRITRSPKA